MYYYSRNIVFIFEDPDVRDEVNRILDKDDLEFFHYISELVEKDISRKLGKRVYDKSDIVEVEPKSLVPVQQTEQMDELMKKMDIMMAALMAGGSVRAGNPNMNDYVNNNNVIGNAPSNFITPADNNQFNVQHNQQVENKDLSIKVEPVVDTEIKEKEVNNIPKPKKKKKGLGLGKMDKNSLLSKMKSMSK